MPFDCFNETICRQYTIIFSYPVKANGNGALWPPDPSNIQLYNYSIRNDINKINFDQLYIR